MILYHQSFFTFIASVLIITASCVSVLIIMMELPLLIMLLAGLGTGFTACRFKEVSIDDTGVVLGFPR